MFWTKTKHPKKPQEETLFTKSIIIRATAGITLLVLSVILMTTDPIKEIVRISTQLKNGSFIFDVFQSEIEGAKVSMTIFNITNSDRFLSGEDYKLKVEEVGPFTYVEIRKNADIDLRENEVSITPHMKVKFVPEESIGFPEHINVTVPSLALMSATSLLQKYSFWIKNGFNLLAYQLGSKSITNLDAQSFLWGYSDPLIGLANRVAPGLIYFDRLGIIDRLYDNKTFYRIKLSLEEEYKFGIKELNKYLKGRSIGDQRPLESHIFNDTYEGISYAPGVTRNTPINIYRTGVCRTLNLEYVRETVMDYGPKAWVYRLSNDTFNRDCGLPGGVCGMLDLSKCTFGIPIALSRTHFLNSDPKLYERIEGMKPDEKVHESVFVIEPKLGYELITNLTLQLNMHLGDLSYNRQTKVFSNMTVPIAYIRVVQPELMDEFKLILRLVHVYGPYILLCIEALLMILAIILLVKAFRIYSEKRRIQNKDILVLSVKEKELPLLT